MVCRLQIAMRTSIAARANLDLLEENYRRWQEIPSRSIPAGRPFSKGSSLAIWRSATARRGLAEAREAAAADAGRWARLRLSHRSVTRLRGSILWREKRPQNPLLSLRELGFSEKDLDLQVSSKFFLDNRHMTLREMIAGLERIYADSIGAEFMHIQNPRSRNWVRHRLESRPDKHDASRAVQIALLRALLEVGIVRDFPAHALRRAETVFPSGRGIAHGDSRHHSAQCPDGGVEEICMGMAHRGRLNVLANFLRKSLKVIFTEFTENYVPDLVAGDGDVKYHLGYRTDRKLASGAEVEIRLAANPSHLEAVDPVVEGTARARQRIRGDTEHRAQSFAAADPRRCGFRRAGDRG